MSAARCSLDRPPGGVLLLGLPLAATLVLPAPARALDPPEVDAPRGVYEAAFSVELTAEGGAEIYVSLDGSAPTEAYTDPLEITSSTILRALARTEDETSATVTHTYLFIEEVMGQSVIDPAIAGDAELGSRMAESLASLPSISLVTEAGLGQDEGPVSFEFFDPQGELSVQTDCGARRVGGHSLAYPKNNIRLYFRDAYGDGRLDVDFFEDQETTGVPPLSRHDSLDLRGGAHDSVFYLASRGQYLRNIWMDETELEQGLLAPHGRFAHLYLDGEYTGLYHLRERFDAAFMAEHLGGSEDDYSAVNGGRAVDGSSASWDEIEAAGGDLETFRTWVELDQYLDYIVLNLFAANTWDWLPHQNWMAAGPDTASSSWVFHSSDNDICLYYPVNQWVLDRPGPGYTLMGLLAEAHPDFMVGLMDALHRNLRSDGPMTGDRAAGRYARLAPLVEDAVIAEAARWGGGAWDPVVHWEAERDHLVEDWLPRRAQELLDDAEAAGWLPLPAPELSHPSGELTPGTEVSVRVPEGVDAELVVRLDGGDPRDPGGAVAAEALTAGPLLEAVLDQGLGLQARLHRDGTWGPVERVLWEVPGDAVVVLNEWNAVQPGKTLDDDGEDAAFGVIEGNGGAWVELLVLQDGLDLRGARLEARDLYGERGTVRFTDHPVLAELRAGTLLTVATDLPEDLAYDPDGGDWRFHVQAGPEGQAAVTAGFVVTQHDWTLTLWTAQGRVLFGPAGEGRALSGGLSSREVGLLATTPDPALRPDSAHFRAGTRSTYGSPNAWEGGEQDLSALRGEVGDTGEVAGDTSDPGEPDGSDGSGGDDAVHPVVSEPAGCGCATAPGRHMGLVFLLPLLGAVLRRRRHLGIALVLTACGGSASPGGTGSAGESDAGTDTSPGDTSADCVSEPETCNGLDDDCDGLVDDADPDLVDGLPFYVDADGDGFGADGALVTACALAEGLALVDGDCDDADASVYPDAPEACDDVDRDCDGLAGDALGRSADCPGETCADLLDADPSAEDGSYFLALPSGTVAEVWCDMAGGGWTLGFLRNSVAAGNQGDFGAGEEGLSALAVDPAESSASGTAALGWLDLNEHDYSELVVASYASGTESFRSEEIPREQLRIAFGEDGYLLYGTPSPYIWCGGDDAYTDEGVGAVNNPSGAPADCRGHSNLGSGWDFSTSHAANAGLTLCGSDGSGFLASTWGGGWLTYGKSGGAQAIWVR